MPRLLRCGTARLWSSTERSLRASVLNEPQCKLSSLFSLTGALPQARGLVVKSGLYPSLSGDRMAYLTAWEHGYLNFAVFDFTTQTETVISTAGNGDEVSAPVVSGDQQCGHGL